MLLAIQNTSQIGVMDFMKNSEKAYEKTNRSTPTITSGLC